jgi:hypothetical protein
MRVEDDAVQAGQEARPRRDRVEAVVDADVRALADAGNPADHVVRFKVAAVRPGRRHLAETKIREGRDVQSRELVDSDDASARWVKIIG